MTEFVIHGDAAAAVVQMLKAATEVTSVIPTNNISTDLIGYDRLAAPLWVVVERHGGNLTFPYHQDRPRVDVECRAQTRQKSHDMAALCQAAILRASGNTVYNAVDCHVTGAKIESGILFAPDRDDSSYRHIFSLRFSTTPK